MAGPDPSACHLYDRVADIPVTIEGYDLERHDRETSSDFTRVTTVVSLHGDGATGKGEDVTYDTADHDRLLESAEFEFAGEYTLESFSELLAQSNLFPGKPPDRARFRDYRQWAFESAALDLALRQADLSMADAVGRECDPVRFVASTRLGDPPTADRVETLLDRQPALEFKLDPSPDWPDELFRTLADMDRVRILDCKAYYDDPEVGVPVDPDWYGRLLERFPDAVIEDPGVTKDTRPLLAAERDRLSWDQPIESLADLRDRPWEPRWLNVKPSRFGSLKSLFETIEYCLERDVTLYGGGQFELDVGRGQIQLMASLLYQDGPNDVAPGVFNAPEILESLPSSPLATPSADAGFRW